MSIVKNYTALLSGQYWSGQEVTGQPIFVTYSFPKRVTTPDYANGGFKPFPKAYRDTVKSALDAWSKVAGIKFLEAERGDVTFGVLDFDKIGKSSAAGFAYYPGGGVGGDIYLDAAYLKETGGLSTLLHEIGHAIGLKHPFDTAPGHYETLSKDLDKRSNTVMSYTWDEAYANRLGKFDIAAAQHIYGKPSKFASNISKYTWNRKTETLQVWGTSHGDKIAGSGAKDIIDGKGGNDKLLGLDGDDRLTGGTGSNTIDGGWGEDTVDYSRATKPVVLSLFDGKASVGSYRDKLIDVEHVIGSKYADRIEGTYDGNKLEGGNGDDVLIGRGGRDKLIGGAGFDIVSYETEYGVTASLDDPRVNGGGAEGDKYSSIEGLIGSQADDVLIGSNNVDNKLSGGPGDDVLIGLSGNDTLDGGEGYDFASYEREGAVFVSLQDPSLNGGAAKGDILISIENLRGSEGNDTLIGSNGVENRLEGGGGNDVLDGLRGADTLVGGSGADTFRFSTAVVDDWEADQIEDFEPGLDVIQLDHAIFTAFTNLGQLAASAFKDWDVGELDADDLIYTSYGDIFYDPDGPEGDAPSIRFAALSNGVTLTEASFYIV